MHPKERGKGFWLPAALSPEVGDGQLPSIQPLAPEGIDPARRAGREQRRGWELGEERLRLSGQLATAAFQPGGDGIPGRLVVPEQLWRIVLVHEIATVTAPKAIGAWREIEYFHLVGATRSPADEERAPTPTAIAPSVEGNHLTDWNMFGAKGWGYEGKCEFGGILI
jgi:hypothetical protein